MTTDGENPEKQLRKAAERLRKAAKAVNAYDERVLSWEATLIPAGPGEKHNTYWVDEHTETGRSEGFRTVADCLWSRADMNYIVMMHPPVALLVADVLERFASSAARAGYASGSQIDLAVKLAEEINAQWKERAKRPKK